MPRPKSNDRMLQLTVSLPEGMRIWLIDRAKRLDQSVSQIIRGLIREKIKAEKPV